MDHLKELKIMLYSKRIRKKDARSTDLDSANPGGGGGNGGIGFQLSTFALSVSARRTDVGWRT